jgi:hypothetical protein
MAIIQITKSQFAAVEQLDRTTTEVLAEAVRQVAGHLPVIVPSGKVLSSPAAVPHTPTEIERSQALFGVHMQVHEALKLINSILLISPLKPGESTERTIEYRTGDLLKKLGLDLSYLDGDPENSTILTHTELARLTLAYLIRSEDNLRHFKDRAEKYKQGGDPLAQFVSELKLQIPKILGTMRSVEFGGFRATQILLALGAKPENCACVVPGGDKFVIMGNTLPHGVTLVSHVVTPDTVAPLSAFLDQTDLILSNQLLSVGGIGRGTSDAATQQQMNQLFEVFALLDNRHTSHSGSLHALTGLAPAASLDEADQHAPANFVRIVEDPKATGE